MANAIVQLADSVLQIFQLFKVEDKAFLAESGQIMTAGDYSHQVSLSDDDPRAQVKCASRGKEENRRSFYIPLSQDVHITGTIAGHKPLLDNFYAGCGLRNKQTGKTVWSKEVDGPTGIRKINERVRLETGEYELVCWSSGGFANSTITLEYVTYTPAMLSAIEAQKHQQTEPVVTTQPPSVTAPVPVPTVQQTVTNPPAITAAPQITTAGFTLGDQGGLLPIVAIAGLALAIGLIARGR